MTECNHEAHDLRAVARGEDYRKCMHCGEDMPIFPSMESSVAELQTKHKRRKFFRLGDDVVVQQASAIVHGRPGFQIRGLPKDIEILGVHHDYQWKGFSFVACSMHWPVASDGMIMEQCEIEIITAPSEDTEYVRWDRTCADFLKSKHMYIETDKALDVVENGTDKALDVVENGVDETDPS